MQISRTATQRLIWLLCVLGAARVIAFSAAYPFFNYIDEGLHFDVVVKFAKVGLPGPGGDHFDVDSARAIATQGSDRLAPPYASARDRLPAPERQLAIEAETRRLVSHRNAETFAPPLYYALAAAWYRLGQALGLTELPLLYWLRFLSAGLYGVTIWLGCRLCTTFHPQRPELAIGTGLILAVFPQDILYSINSDVLSPLAVVLALYLLLRWMHAGRPSIALAVAAGVAAALAMLVKYTNVSALAILPVAILVAPRRRSAAEVAALLLAAAIPLAAWMLRSHVLFGDWTGIHDKAAQLDWTTLSLSESLRHPIFSLLGMLDFLSRLCLTFWRGELVWNNAVQALRSVDVFYFCVSALALLGTAGWLFRPSANRRAERPLVVLYTVAVAAGVLFLAVISARFDYGHCFFPSRGFPYFAAGRLLSGALVPAVVLFVGGASELTVGKRGFNVAVPLAALVAVVCISSELYLCLSAHGAGASSVFQSPYNLYHLR